MNVCLLQLHGLWLKKNKKQGCDWIVKPVPLLLKTIFASRPSLSLPYHNVFVLSFTLDTLSLDPSPWLAPPVSLRGTGRSWATRPPGEWKGTGGAGPSSMPIPRRVERPQRGLGRSPSLLLSARRPIGTGLKNAWLRVRNAATWSWLSKKSWNNVDLIVQLWR